MNEQERVDFFKKQITLEKDIVTAAQASVEGLENKIVRELILGIALDSNKHASLLTALTASVEGKNPLISEKITDRLKKNLETHIELENKAIQTYQDLMGHLEDEKEKLIVKFILNDEIRHHKLLKQLHSMIVEKETITEEELWDTLWGDALWSGTPGG